MKCIKASYSILSEFDGKEVLQRIERAGRTCYKSEEKITETSAEKFIQMLITKGHESVLEHVSLSVLFICDRGVSHELVRHRIASFAQESTRYCNYSSDKFGNELTFILPPWVNPFYVEMTTHPLGVNTGYVDLVWVRAMQIAEDTYNTLIEKGWQAQQARSVLPNSLKTEIVVTANLREWRTIFKQRTSPAAHPQMREIMCPLLSELKTRIPIVFDDIESTTPQFKYTVR